MQCFRGTAAGVLQAGEFISFEPLFAAMWFTNMRKNYGYGTRELVLEAKNGPCIRKVRKKEGYESK